MNFQLAPEQASNFAAKHDAIFYTITALTIFFTLGVCIAVVLFAVLYRRGRKIDRSNPQHHNLKLELGWSIPPLILGVGIFFWSALVFVEEHKPPPDCTEIFVIGKQWMWHIQHANGVRENNTLHVPVGKPIKLIMISQDVIHAMYLPAMRVQYHVVPGRYTQIWFTPTKVGKYNLFCNMYCGTQHSKMGGFVYVMPDKDFEKWLANGGDDPKTNLTMAQQGKEIFDRMNCSNCHGTENSLRAPTLHGLFGRKRDFADGSSAIADNTYIRDSILNPYNKVVKGFEKIMPVNYGFTEDEIMKLTAYIRSLGVTQQATPAASNPTTVAKIDRIDGKGTTE
ncbi:MAG: cytochrome c oxidase subunit 2 [Fimbriimonadaceae bacterium]|nr:cytochrome c oxidase subunit 2 [Fimbriimonadaceae bacterium]